MGLLSRHCLRIGVTLVPVGIALLHAIGMAELAPLRRLDDALYDLRLRATMPRTLDERIAIVDIDEKSLAELGHWPWGRDKMAQLVDELFDRQQVAVLGFDVLFAEADDSSGLHSLQQLAQGPLRQQPGFAEQLRQLAPQLDYDQRFAHALAQRPVALGYYFTSDRDGRTKGALPAPVLRAQDLAPPGIHALSWNGYGANLPNLSAAAAHAGFFNAITDADGVVRALPLLAQYQGHYYESLALAVFRLLRGQPELLPAYAPDQRADQPQVLEGLLLHQGERLQSVPVDRRAATLVPYRGPGGARGGSFRYVSASDVLAGRLPAGQLKGKVVLVGSTAPGLQDLRVTPVGETYPGVETHANVISGLLDGRSPARPDYATGYEVLALLVAGLLLAFALPLLSVPAGAGLALALAAALAGLNFWLYRAAALVLPLAAQLLMVATAFGLNIAYGYFVESRAKRQLAKLFGTYVPRELVQEMLRQPGRYSMQAASRELTVMFCDMRGFTALSERMEPLALQALLNSVFSRLTETIRAHRGTIDKYMGDCVMAFWGAPVAEPGHARLAVAAALAMVDAVQALNVEHRARGLPQVDIGIGLNTGSMCVGDMGSDIRRSYTVVGDAVNLGARLEGLSKVYGVAIVASDSTRQQAGEGFTWRELDRVRVQGKQQAVGVFSPQGAGASAEPDAAWAAMLEAYRRRDWDQAQALLQDLAPAAGQEALHALYLARIVAARQSPPPADWDGTTRFDTK
ncbi:adenylate/guanylate cyclase domain-containing protein [Xylophilus sp. GW821-FHT01B05]